MFTVLEGVSIFCLAHQDSLVFTNLFGGASGNEGLGFCMKEMHPHLKIFMLTNIRSVRLV
jgi:hypothetical protein